MHNKFQNEYQLDRKDNLIEVKDTDIKLKIKNDPINNEEELETQIKDKIHQIEEEIVTLKGKAGHFGWNKEDHNLFLKTYNSATTKQRNDVEEMTSMI